MKTSFLWRSMLYVPSNNEKFLNKANRRGADAIILDLEDSIPSADKPAARRGLDDAVKTVSSDETSVLVRINRPLTDAISDIIAATLTGVDALMLPKIESSDHLLLLEEVLSGQEEAKGIELGSIKLVPMIETAKGYFRMEEIANASSRNVGMTLGGEDFALETGMVPDEDTLFLASQKVVYASRSANIMPLGTIGTVADYSDLGKYKKSAAKSRRFGFEGAACIHPSIINILNEEFSPKKEEVIMARRIIEAYEKAIMQGVGAISLDGQMIDVPVAERARKTLKIHAQLKEKTG